MRESVLEKYFREQIETRGGLCEKHTSPGRKGVPDRLVTIPYTGGPEKARMELVELKSPRKKGKLDAAQGRDHERRAKAGIKVVVIWMKEQVDRYVAVRFGTHQ